MSLKVWLPLNGNLENIGCSNIVFTNSNAVVNTNGKIGSCYSFNGSNAQIYATHDRTIWSGKEISIAFWYKYDSTNTTNVLVDITADLCVSYTGSSSGLKFNYWRAWSNNGTRTGDSGSTSQYYNSTIWHHVVATFDHAINKIYVDGILADTFDRSNKYTTNWVPLLGTSYNRISIGKSAGSNPFASGLLNDIRIYNHCLSAAEVHEISQGLVLHYKLDDLTNGVRDSSGYNHNGWNSGATLVSSGGRYSNALACIGTTVDASSNTLTGAQYFFGNISLTTPSALTVAWWGKNDAYGRGGIFETTATTFTATTGMNGTDYNTTAISNWDTTFRVYNGSSAFNFFSSFNKNGAWHHHSITFDATKAYYYCDGTLVTSGALTGTLPSFNGVRMGLGRAGGVYRQIKETISDLRIYCTALSAADIKALYEVGAKVDNLGGLHTFEAVENIPNIIFKIDSARAAKVFQDGLSSYTQANCQVTLTDNGYRIYRPPNLTTSANGNTMWGGLKLVNQTSDTISAYTTPRDNCWNLQQNHTYLCAFHAKGQSSNGTTFSWTNNMGWGGGGVSPSPTIIINDGVPNNFQGEKDCIFIFTIGDKISKACTSAYSSYAAGTTYLSYRHLTFGWGYSSTGSLGTDIYLTNLRLYDITDFIGKIKKTGQANFGDFVENNSIARILKKAEFLTNNLIEL